MEMLVTLCPSKVCHVPPPMIWNNNHAIYCRTVNHVQLALFIIPVHVRRFVDYAALRYFTDLY